VATTGTDTGSVTDHPRPWSGVGDVGGLVGLYDVPSDTSGAALYAQTKPESETETEGSYDIAPSQSFRDRPPPLLPSHTPNNSSGGVGVGVGRNVEHVGATSAGVGQSTSGIGVARTGKEI